MGIYGKDIGTGGTLFLHSTKLISAIFSYSQKYKTLVQQKVQACCLCVRLYQSSRQFSRPVSVRQLDEMM